MAVGPKDRGLTLGGLTHQQSGRPAQPPGFAPERSRVLAAALSGVLIALTIWGGRLDVIPRGILEPSSLAGVNQATTVAGRSGNSQAAHTSVRGPAGTLSPCRKKPNETGQQSHLSSAAACGPVSVASRSSAGGSVP